MNHRKTQGREEKGHEVDVSQIEITESPVPSMSRSTEKKRIALSILPPGSNSARVVEVLTEAAFLREKNGDARRILFCEDKMSSFFTETGLFDEVRTLDDDQSIKSQIKKLKPDILHIPDQGGIMDWMLSFGKRNHVCIGRRLKKRSFPFAKIYDQTDQKDLEVLKEKGWSLEGMARLRIELKPVDKIPRNSVWLNLSAAMDSAIQWSVGHAGRISRLLEKNDFTLVVPVCSTHGSQLDGEQIRYLKKVASRIYFHEACDLQERLRGIASTRMMITPAGAELTYAGMLGLPAIVLQTSSQAEKEILKANASPGENGNSSIAARVFEAANGRLSFPGVFQYHISPYDHEADCDDGCHSCASGSCIDMISPERVYELMLQEKLL